MMLRGHLPLLEITRSSLLHIIIVLRNTFALSTERDAKNWKYLYDCAFRFSNLISKFGGHFPFYIGREEPKTTEVTFMKSRSNMYIIIFLVLAGSR